MKKLIIIMTAMAFCLTAKAQTPNALTPGSGSGIDTFELNRSVQLDTFKITETNADSYQVIRPKDVVLSNVAPTGTAIALTWWDTLTTTGIDSLWVNHAGTWVYNDAGSGSAMGAPFYTTADNFATFHPSEVPPIGALVWNLDQGALYRKYGVSSYFTITEPNGRLVKGVDRYFQFDSLDTWDWDLNAAAEIQINGSTPDSIGYVDRPLNFGGGQTGGSRVIVVNNELGVATTVNWDSVYHNDDLSLLLTTTIPAACKVVYEFSVDAVDTVGLVLKLLSSNQTQGGGLDSTQIADFGFLVNGGNDSTVIVGSNTAGDSLLFETQDTTRGGFDENGNFWVDKEIKVSGGNAGLLGESLVSQGIGLPAQYKRLGGQNTIAVPGATTVFAWNSYSTDAHILVQAVINTPGTVIQLPDPTLALSAIASVTVKFAAIDPIQTAQITTVGGTGLLDDGTGFVSTINISSSDAWKSWTWFTEGTKWYLKAVSP